MRSLIREGRFPISGLNKGNLIFQKEDLSFQEGDIPFFGKGDVPFEKEDLPSLMGDLPYFDLRMEISLLGWAISLFS
jgi:hypothetical protein